MRTNAGKNVGWVGRAVGLALLGLLVAPVLAGCGSGSAGADGTMHGTMHGDTHVMPDGSTMSDAEMSGMSGMGAMGDQDKGQHPTEPARMICSHEVAEAVQRTLALPATPRATDAWKAPTYRCSYALPRGTLVLTVADLPSGSAAAQQRYADTRTAVSGARRIVGMQSFGLPAFESTAGQVGFLKDGRTLLVDATGVPDGALPPGFSRMGVAYGVAAAVIACWTE
jgi:hypothetical protein